ncbi:MAG: cob(I)yrinic acid a,c-diamide adenosyltransferase [Burkholderiales bacterium]|nr:cob(I)yrinic acid a,c-diamide adenosyltransferase [Burkholderiales bacterium]
MRLTKISTKTGDEGSTGLGDGSRVGKESLRIEVIGNVDELNSAIGLILSEPLPEAVRICLETIQHDLFELGAELCLPGEARIGESHVARLEDRLERMNSTLPHLAEFVLPGGARAAALCHVARTVARSAERSLVGLSRVEAIGPNSLKYLNRLSDLLFVAARAINRSEGCPDVLWKPGS